MKTVSNILISLMIMIVANNARAHVSEVFVKKMNDRIQALLKSSLEAQVFLGEDLLAASDLLDSAEIVWTEDLSQYPFLNGQQIYLSEAFSFQASNPEKIVLVMEILFHLKRQLEASQLPLPEVRIHLFAQKFSPILLGEKGSCTFSLYPLQIPLTSSQRENVTKNVLSLISSSEFEYDSKWAEWILVIKGKERTDGGCHGNNRNIMEVQVELFNMRELASTVIAKVRTESCGYETKHRDEMTKKLSKEIKKHMPKCHNALGF